MTYKNKQKQHMIYLNILWRKKYIEMTCRSFQHRILDHKKNAKETFVDGFGMNSMRHGFGILETGTRVMLSVLDTFFKPHLLIDISSPTTIFF